MRNIVCKAQLEGLVDRINTVTRSPYRPWEKGLDGKFTANVGNYHLDWAYGGVKLVRMHTEGGGISEPLGSGFWSKRELWHLMRAFLTGLENKHD